uniref:YqaE/Pmp3 family membrane protein n=1 Tax=Parastrongyloides trichosuri TaxID=131310 RepID=A0A0N4Z3K0_PARTI
MAKTCCMVIVYIFVSIFFPPLAILMSAGCGCTFLINILLTLLGVIPGIIHALWVSLGKEEQ